MTITTASKGTDHNNSNSSSNSDDNKQSENANVRQNFISL